MRSAASSVLEGAVILARPHLPQVIADWLTRATRGCISYAAQGLHLGHEHDGDVEERVDPELRVESSAPPVRPRAPGDLRRHRPPNADPEAEAQARGLVRGAVRWSRNRRMSVPPGIWLAVMKSTVRGLSTGPRPVRPGAGGTRRSVVSPPSVEIKPPP